MCQPLKQILLAMILCILLSPALGRASGIGAADTPLSQPEQSANDTVTGTVPVLPQVPDIKYHEAGAPPPEASESAPSSGQKDQIKVVYDPETEQDRSKMIALVIAFGISLALNIYLATSLFSARRR